MDKFSFDFPLSFLLQKGNKKATEIEADVSALTVLKKLKNVSSHCYMLESNDDANTLISSTDG